MVAAREGNTPSTIRVGRKARVWPVPPVRTSTNNSKDDNVVAGGRWLATDKGTGEHTVVELRGVRANEDDC